jgi:NADH-quinone oxidoreductase subunit L
MFLTFWGEPRGDKHTHDHAHESPMVMLVPLGVLALGAVFAGMIWYNSFFGKTDKVANFFNVPFVAEAAHGDDHGAAKDDHGAEAKADDHGAEAKADDHAAADAGHGEDKAHGKAEGKAAKPHYVLSGNPGAGAIYAGPENDVINEAHYVPKWVKLSPFIAMIIGLATAIWFYLVNPSLPGRLAQNQRPLYLFLLNKWYFDEIYDFAFVRPARALGALLWKRGDGNVIDGTINGVAMGIIPFFTRLAGRAQSGYIFTYAFAMVIGIAVLVTWMTISGGAE